MIKIEFEKIDLFWKKFNSLSENLSEALLSENDEKTDKLSEEILDHLHEVCDQIFFELEILNGENTFILTAEADIEYFPLLISMAERAPQISGWDIIAFKQPEKEDFESEWEGLTLKTNNMWFLPLNNKEDEYQVGIQVCFPGYYDVSNDDHLPLLYEIIVRIVGEKSFAEDIDYMEAAELPKDPYKKGYIKIMELPSYLEWFKNKEED